ncbi:MAG: amino acid adenylation domain-containing protein [Gammaproteobacteria bacterium]|nr:amino acid adenylation domain-containing protein [Gammaproteobacteria bacterium]
MANKQVLKLLKAWNQTKKEFPQKTVYQLFEEQVEKAPDNIAVIFKDQELTYRELNEKSNQLAHYLRKLGVKPNTLVAICLERSFEMIIGILGILKAGGAYVPLDPDYPEARLSFILNDTQAPILLTESKFLEKLRGYRGKIICFDQAEDIRTIQQEPIINPEHINQLNDLIYVIYTSGSTGQPKGVGINYDNILNYTYWFKESFQLDETSIVDFSSSLSFDFSVTSTLLPFMFGTKLILGKEKLRLEPKNYLQHIKDYQITHIKLTPSSFSELLLISQKFSISLPDLKWIILGGEQLNKKDVQNWLNLNPSHHIVNEYGPTETTVAVIAYIVEPKTITCHKTVPIGKPAYNTQVYVLDEKQALVSIGDLGELYIGGANVARGYLNRPELTKEKFIPNPFSNDLNSRLYKTGDLVRWLSDGNLEFIGRIDNQVKIRGFRVELEEVEYYLNQYSEIKQVVVVAKTGPDNNQYLAAYLCLSKKNLHFKKLRTYLESVLPEHMIPSVYFKLGQIPLTVHGKTDRKILAQGAYDQHLIKTNGYLAPKKDVEKNLVHIWSKILALNEESIGIDDNFFQLGGHSLVAIRLISKIQQAFAVPLSIHEVFDYSTISQLSGLIEEKQSLAQMPSILPLKHRTFFPLSFAQEQIWLHAKIVHHLPLYNEPLNIYMPHRIDIKAMEQALNVIIKRHDILRVRFISREDQILQSIRPFKPLHLNFIDLRSYPAKQRKNKAIQLATQDAEKLFDLEKDLLIRFLLIQLNDCGFWLFTTVHHLLIDAVSMFQIFKNELEQIYQNIIQNQEIDLPTLPLQYADYTLWLRKFYESKFVQDIAYWKEQLKDFPDFHLPTISTYGNYPSSRGKRECFKFPKDLTRKLKQLAQQEHVTYFIVLLTAFNVLFYRYTNQLDIPIGSVVSGRDHPLVENLIGNFLNTIVFRNDLSQSPSFLDLLQRVKKTSLAAYDHRFIPFHRLSEELSFTNRKFQPIHAAFIIEPQQTLSQLGWVMSQLEVHLGLVKFDLVFEIDELDAKMIGRVEYNDDLFNLYYIQNMIAHFEYLLHQIVQNPKKLITEFELLTAQEKQRLLVDWNRTEEKFPQKTVQQLFEEQVVRTPDNIAVIYEDQRLTYRELNEKSNQLAHYLRKLGVKPDTLVAICLERSFEMIIGILGILKAGGAYVPLDPDYPEARLSFILNDTQADFLLTRSNLIFDLQGCRCVSILFDKDSSKIFTGSKINLGTVTQPHNLAQIIYTSGSTGLAKGVMIEHINLTVRLLLLQKIYDLNCQSSSLFYKTYCFDAAIAEYFLPLIVGAKIVIIPQLQQNLIEILDHFIDLYEVKTIHFLYSLLPLYLKYLVDGQKTKLKLQRVISGGGVLSPSTVKKFFEIFPNTKLFNIYGPTEVTIDSTIFECYAGLENDYQTIPIGKPIANTQVYVLDPQLNPLPVYVPGELYIGGEGVARGYLNRPESTKEKFISNPFSNDPNSRLYKTGDLVRWLPDGYLEFLGRLDHQVKIRGFRIELGEIEHYLAQHELVSQAVVIVHGDNQNEEDKYLAAYLVLKKEKKRKNDTLFFIRQFLKEQLPEYMIPSTFAILETLPLLPNGKIDRKALPKPQRNRDLISKKYSAPKTNLHKEMLQIWSKILNVERIGIDDDFFELGGHSVAAIKTIDAINRHFNIDLPVCEIFHNATIRTLSKVVDVTFGV